MCVQWKTPQKSFQREGKYVGKVQIQFLKNHRFSYNIKITTKSKLNFILDSMSLCCNFSVPATTTCYKETTIEDLRRVISEKTPTYLIKFEVNDKVSIIRN